MKGEQWLLTPIQLAGEPMLNISLQMLSELDGPAQWDSWGRLMQAFANTTSLRECPLPAMHCTVCVCTVLTSRDPNISSQPM